jgi:hypothetical protein
VSKDLILIDLAKAFQCGFCDDTLSGAQMYLSNGGCPVCDVPVNYKISED